MSSFVFPVWRHVLPSTFGRAPYEHPLADDEHSRRRIDAWLEAWG